MKSLDARLTALETHLAQRDDGVAWGEVDAAMRRQQTRVRLTVCRGLGVEADDPRLRHAEAALVSDRPALIAADEAIIRRWRQQQGIPPDKGDVRQRLQARLAEMVQRSHAHEQTPS